MDFAVPYRTELRRFMHRQILISDNVSKNEKNVSKSDSVFGKLCGLTIKEQELEFCTQAKKCVVFELRRVSFLRKLSEVVEQ